MVENQVYVYVGSVCLGLLDEDDARDVLRRKEGTLERSRGRRRIILRPEASKRVRALCNTSSQSAMSSTQREELYSGSRRDHTDAPVTAVLTVVRKLRNGSFSNWTETDRFPSKRFNPDNIRTPAFASMRDFSEHQSGVQMTAQERQRARIERIIARRRLAVAA